MNTVARLRERMSRPWSLRSRLVLGILAILALVSVAVAVLSVVALRSFLLTQLDDRVQQVLERSQWAIEQQLGGPTVGPPPGLGTAQASGTLGLIAVDGALLQPQYYDELARVRSLMPSQQSALTDVPASGVATSVDLGGLGSYRIIRVPIADRVDLFAGLPQQEVDDTVGQLAVFVIAVTALGLVAAAAIGTTVVRVALRPLHRVTATAARVTALPLDRGDVAVAERVPDTDPHTEVGRLGAALNRMLEHVAAALGARQRSEERLRRFVADASHELRTPLASIRGYSEHSGRVLQALDAASDSAARDAAARDDAEPADAVPADIRHSLARIESESVRMSALVDELLLLARLDAGTELAHDAVDLAALVADAVSDAAVAAPDHEWSLALPEAPLEVLGDAPRLQQALGNLLANARQHTPPGTHVEIEVTADAASVVIGVTDDGPGIPAALQASLFERFARGDDSRSRGSGGSGLGLAITRAVAEGHGGSVTVESEPGRTRFELRIPRHPHAV